MPVAVPIERAKKILDIVSLRSRIPVWIWGPAGVGKSSLVKQVAQDPAMKSISKLPML